MNSVVEHRQLVEEILTEELMPQHPYIEMIDSRSGPRPVIKGTPIGSDVLVGYSHSSLAHTLLGASAMLVSTAP